MSRRAAWRAVFLGLTVFVLGMEVWASADGDPETEPWTDLIIQYIPGEVAAVLIGGLMLWLPVHFGLRYWRRHRTDA